MIDPRYMQSGLSALARAHEVSTMAGHLGAAVVAGCFVGEQHPDLPDAVCRGIEGEFERIIQGESVFSPKENTPRLFESFPDAAPDPDPTSPIAEALTGNIEEPHQSGHNVIFAAIAIRALTDHPELATPPVVEGVRTLTAAFDGTTPGSGYYGKERGRIDGRKVEIPPETDFPPYADLEDMANTTLDALIDHAAEYREGYGSLWHVINHAAALVELARYGYAALAQRGLAAHHRHMVLWRSLPDVSDEKGPETPTQHHPLDAAFWQTDDIRRERAHLTHRIKTLYGLQVLMDRTSDAARREEAGEKLLYLM